MNQAELQEILTGFAADRLALLERHEAGARVVSHYDFNNAYQYVINREETQLSWLAKAIADLGGAVPNDQVAPQRPVSGKRGAAWRTIVEEDATEAQAFVKRWRPRVEALTHARHRNLLRVILGETLEQQRLFEQALAGRTDLLGRRAEELGPAIGEVLPARWVE